MVKSGSGQTFAIVYNGELYNTDELRQELMAAGCSFQTSSDTEVILAGYMEYGPDFVKRLNGIFAFAIMDTALNRLCLFRDRAGVKPLFYTTRDEELIFSSELKGILAYPGIKARLDRRGLSVLHRTCQDLRLRRSKGHGGAAPGTLPHMRPGWNPPAELLEAGQPSP